MSSFPPAYQLEIASDVVAKLWRKHKVLPTEAREAFERREQPKRGPTTPRGTRVYAMYGRTYAGRRLFLVVERVPTPGSPIRAILKTAYEAD